MNRHLLGAILFFIMIQGASCVPRQIRAVSDIDPAPLVQKVMARQAALRQGVSGSLELSFKKNRRTVNSKVYIVALPDGRFRLEVPGPFGDTHVVMANDNRNILAYYPGKNTAYQSAADSRSLSRHLPFPIHVDPARIGPMITGLYPENSRPDDLEAHLLDNGEMRLTAISDDGYRYSYLFGKGPDAPIRMITILGPDWEISIETRPEGPYLPGKFTIILEDAVIKGEWDVISLFEGDDSILTIRLPDSVPVSILETSP